MTEADDTMVLDAIAGRSPSMDQRVRLMRLGLGTIRGGEFQPDHWVWHFNAIKALGAEGMRALYSDLRDGV